ncbi:4-alpha-glucanotransferase [Streptococcus loxodontisalivarius]|uniref:4-alpha-glucanotransferase n=1 Tax=Streptococcus loxodontisalivarius TaxID=1349415 RepID=A0ABS2PSK0_9STRE|nr:4-alpha-glucanotransferase [Streptococcus loxodontisalivarius]MBM7642525.1 4-alpha-glucanotransferase [Streptococcus loxodontisalivarius]
MKRASGILMHITSLPGEFGIGTFGKEAYDFIDFLVETKQTYWQILPLTTTSYGDSPYQSFSAVAGNTNLIDFNKLVDAGYLSPADFAGVTFSHADNQVDYALLFEARRPILEKAVANFLASQEGVKLLADFEAEQSTWLQDYAEFMSLKEHFGLKALQEWDDQKAIYRDEETLASYREELKDAILYHKVVQLFFFSQWQELKTYANEKGIAIIGDMPIYVSADSVEVWTQSDLFKLDDAKQPLCIAGCPPDDFSDVGQLWGNPIYNWDYHAETGYKWWIYRIQESFKLYDYLRIDHFKGFSDFWEIPAGEETAINGKWVSGPNIDLFNAIKAELGDLPIIAEDLGYIDDKAKKLLADAAFPGMKILEFGFYDVTGQSIDIPHVYTQNSVAYVGTHDNEVANGWYDNLDEEQQAFVDAYTNRKEDESVTQMMLRELFSTVSNTAIASMQDVLDLPAESRMNIPNTLGGNWVWRMTKDDLKQEHKDYLLKITELYARGTQEDDN